MKTPLPTRRRWARFSLRTLFVLVTLVCIYLGWAMNWIRQRHAFLANQDALVHNDSVHAPFALRFMGEEGYPYFYLEGSEEEIRELERLFPEAVINPFMRVLPQEP